MTPESQTIYIALLERMLRTLNECIDAHNALDAQREMTLLQKMKCCYLKYIARLKDKQP